MVYYDTAKKRKNISIFIQGILISINFLAFYFFNKNIITIIIAIIAIVVAIIEHIYINYKFDHIILTDTGIKIHQSNIKYRDINWKDIKEVKVDKNGMNIDIVNGGSAQVKNIQKENELLWLLKHFSNKYHYSFNEN